MTFPSADSAVGNDQSSHVRLRSVVSSGASPTISRRYIGRERRARPSRLTSWSTGQPLTNGATTRRLPERLIASSEPTPAYQISRPFFDHAIPLAAGGPSSPLFPLLSRRQRLPILLPRLGQSTIVT